MSKSILIPVEKPENIVGIGFGENDYDILTKNDVEQILETFYEEFITSGALAYILQKDSTMLHLCRAWGWSDTPQKDRMYEILEKINAEHLMGG